MTEPSNQDVPKPFIDRTGNRATVGSLVTDLVSAKDSAWFAAHPGRRFYERPVVPGEFDVATSDDGPDVPGNLGAEAVLVEQIAPGMRIRRVIFHGDCRADVLARTHPALKEWAAKHRKQSS